MIITHSINVFRLSIFILITILQNYKYITLTRHIMQPKTVSLKPDVYNKLYELQYRLNKQTNNKYSYEWIINMLIDHYNECPIVKTMITNKD